MLFSASISALIPLCSFAGAQELSSSKSTATHALTAGGTGFSNKVSTAALQINPIENFGVVSGNIYRGGRLKTETEYKYLKEVLGASYIINLERFNRDNKVLCKKYGLNCVEFPLLLVLGNDAVFNWTTFRKAYSFVLDKSKNGNKIYFHCLHGSDRTGTLASALMIRNRACNKQGFDKKALSAEIETTLQKHGFHDIYVFLHHKIKSWVIHFDENSEWLCK